MPIKVGVPRETSPGEKRVALVPSVVPRLAKLGVEIQIEKGAGEATRIPDQAYQDVTLVDDNKTLYKDCDIILKVHPPSQEQIKLMAEGSILISFLQATREVNKVKLLRDRKITTFAVELVPRITRAQGIDALSSQASAAGYKAALIAANELERFFPMLTTAAGTIRPAKVLVIGAGVAGLQAIATAKRLGAQVEGYDVRSATKEQIESLGARFVQVDVSAEGQGGYARELTDEEKRQQQEILAKHVEQSDAVITTAAIPGRTAPVIVTKAMVERMKAGAVLVDLAAETGGNCELTKAGEHVLHGQVTIIGPTNVPSQLAEHAAEMYSRNLFNFLELIIKDGELQLDWDDEVVAGTALTHDGEIRHEASREIVEGEQE